MMGKDTNNLETLVADITPYGTASTLIGNVVVEFADPASDGCSKFFYSFQNYPADCVNCGIHIHAGSSCEPDSIGPHYWNLNYNMTDTWLTEGKYSALTAPNGAFTFQHGYGFEDNIGKGVVIHNQAGDKIGCGVLEELPRNLACVNNNYIDHAGAHYDHHYDHYMATITPYPGSGSSISGTFEFDFKEPEDGCSVAKYSLQNITAGCVDCGIHIHDGTSCADVGPHYWDMGFNLEDTWILEGKYNSEVGAFTFNDGYSIANNVGKPIVVHAPDGSKIGCGVIEYHPGHSSHSSDDSSSESRGAVMSSASFVGVMFVLNVLGIFM